MVTERKDDMKKILKKFINFLLKIIMFLFSKIRRKKYIVFTSFNGKQYSDNPKAISETLHNIDKKIPIVWLFKEKKNNIPSYIIQKKYNTLSIMWNLAGAKCWVSNCFDFAYISDRIYKCKNQYYLDTWHGDRGFKKIGYDMKNFLSNGSSVENGFIDTITSGSKFFSRVLISAYRYKGEIIESGCPRNDILISNKKKENSNMIKVRCNPSKKNLLFAPTFGSETIKIFNDNFYKINQKLSNNFNLLFRSHNLDNSKTKLIDVSDVEDMADLLSETDILITDYSSCAGDFLLTGKPVIVCQFDKENYNDSRGLYFDIEESGYTYAKSIDDLIDIIKSINYEQHKIIDKKILDFYGSHETGNSAYIVAKKIIEKYKDN